MVHLMVVVPQQGMGVAVALLLAMVVAVVPLLEKATVAAPAVAVAEPPEEAAMGEGGEPEDARAPALAVVVVL